MDKSTMIESILRAMNTAVKKKNEELCKQRRHDEQATFSDGDMFFKLAFMDEKELYKIYKNIGGKK